MHPFVQSFADELVKLGAAKSVLTPRSSNVKGWSYDPRRQELTVTFRSGGTYRYSEVPPSVARAMRRNKSAGKTIHKWVKAPGFAYEKVSSVKQANGDMLQYFADHPDKLREYKKRSPREDVHLTNTVRGRVPEAIGPDGEVIVKVDEDAIEITVYEVPVDRQAEGRRIDRVIIERGPPH